jgi:anti-sigma factor RsiW
MTDWTPVARSSEDPAEEAAREARHQVLIELLGAYSDRELPPETTSQLEAHLVGCARCRRELAVQQAVRHRLADEPPVGAPSALRERIAAAIAAAPAPARVATAPQRRTPRLVWLVIAATVLVISATFLTRALRDDSPAVQRIELATAHVPMLVEILADYRRATAGDLPGRSRDLDLVRTGVPFPVEPLRASDARLVGAWTANLGGEPAAVLAYRWGDQVVLQYFVPEERFFLSQAVRRAVAGGRLLVTSGEAQGMVAWPTREAGTILVGDLPAERLARLAVSEPLAGRQRAGAE